MEVHRVLGAGFAEAVYQEALQLELGRRQVPFEAQRELQIDYKGTPLQKRYIADLVCFGNLIVELKAIHSLGKLETAQLINYLRATHIRVGLLFNFGNPAELEWHRLIY